MKQFIQSSGNLGPSNLYSFLMIFNQSLYTVFWWFMTKHYIESDDFEPNTIQSSGNWGPNTLYTLLMIFNQSLHTVFWWFWMKHFIKSSGNLGQNTLYIVLVIWDPYHSFRKILLVPLTLLGDILYQLILLTY